MVWRPGIANKYCAPGIAPADPNNQVVIDGQNHNVMNPYYVTARNRARGVDWGGVASDLGEIAFSVGRDLAIGRALESAFGRELGGALDAERSVAQSAGEAKDSLGNSCAR